MSEYLNKQLSINPYLNILIESTFKHATEYESIFKLATEYESIFKKATEYESIFK